MANHTYEAIHETLNRIGDRWTIYVVQMLCDGPKRFNQLKRKIKNISSRMLTVTLKKLERDGIVTRTPHAVIPLRIDYRLTELGLTFLEPMLQLLVWADDHRPEVQAARDRYDATRLERSLPVVASEARV